MNWSRFRNVSEPDIDRQLEIEDERSDNEHDIRAEDEVINSHEEQISSPS